MIISTGLMIAAIISPSAPDFELRDVSGKTVRLSVISQNRPTVVVFLGVDCPMANLYSTRLNEFTAHFPANAIALLAIDPHHGDDSLSMRHFARDHKLTFPFLKDDDGRIAMQFGATRTPQAFVLDANRRIQYRGRIDDQYTAGGKNRGAPTREDLIEAVREVLAGKPVTVPFTECTGCQISSPRPHIEPARVTYSHDIAPILAAHCQECHRPGQVGPFSLLSYADATNHAATIAEVVEHGTMPPWHASPKYGRFRNQRRLSNDQKRLIAEWVELGCPEGEPSKLTTSETATTGWQMGTPDVVLPIPRDFLVPAEGIIEYQHFLVDPGFTADVWVNAIEVRPGNRRVVHHCSVFLLPPNAGTDEVYETGILGSFFLDGYTPGIDPIQLPPGMAKRIPAGWRLHFVIHYTTIGTAQTDHTELGIRLADPHTVRKEVATKFLCTDDIAIPPHTADYRVEQSWTAPRDVLLLSMFPHMHLRGKSFRYTAEYPDGTSEILLDVPEYDFNWQHWYQLAEPKRLPAKTVIRCCARYDNSKNNPFNPDPTATVHAGPQSTDEMFNGYFDIVLAAR